MAAFVITRGGLRREKATGVAQFTLGLPVACLRLFLIRAALACAQSISDGEIAVYREVEAAIEWAPKWVHLCKVAMY